MNERPHPEAVREERRSHARVQDAVALHLRRAGESATSVGDARPRVRRANKYDIEGYAAVRREHPDVADYIDVLEERIRQLLLDGDVVESAPTHKVSLSLGGIAFADPRLFEPGETLGVTLTLFPSGRRIACDARVVSANDAPEVAVGDRPRYRLAFEHVSEADRAALAEHIAVLSGHRPADDG